MFKHSLLAAAMGLAAMSASAAPFTLADDITFTVKWDEADSNNANVRRQAHLFSNNNDFTAAFTVATGGLYDLYFNLINSNSTTYELYIDDKLVNLATNPDTSKYAAFYNDVPLIAGPHTMVLWVTPYKHSAGNTTGVTDYAGAAAETPNAPAAAVPEPGTLALLGLGMLGLGALRRRKE